ncbi:MAG: OmpA family protein [Desulfomonile tiedjei]|nr:OmpA family protein [Desulfomonile tiedjei]
MGARYLIPVLTVTLFCASIGSGTPVAADQEAQINRFYQATVDALKAEGTQAEPLAGLVEKNRALAEKCLAVIKEKAAESGDAQQSFRYLADRLEESLWFTSKQPNCDPQTVEKMLDAAKKRVDDGDKIFYLQSIARQCPQAGTAYHWLGDVYMKRGQVGMAVDAYKKGLQVKNDEDSRAALATAEQMLSEYRQGKPIQKADVRQLLKTGLMAPMKGVTIRKVEVRNALATNQVHFDEWSAQIRPDALPQLKAVGEALKQELQAGTKVGVIVEGHTDRRGPLERNMQLSKERAEAIKKYLVQNFQIDPSLVVTEGYGPSRPYSPGEDDSGHALNRRVEFKKTNVSPGR